MSTPDEMGLTPEAAQGYEQFFVPAIFHQWPARLISVAEITPQDDVLDVGCGTGAMTREIVPLANHTSGLDFSESMLSVAREQCPSVVFQQGNVLELPYADSSFDAVLSAFMLMFVPDPQQAVREMRRVLRPGGRIVVGVWQGLEDNPVYAALVESTREVVDEAAAALMAWPFTMGSAGHLARMFAMDGLGNVTIEAQDGTARFPSVEEFVAIEVQAWLLADSVSSDELAAITAALRTRFADFERSEGPVEFALNANLVRAEAV